MQTKLKKLTQTAQEFKLTDEEKTHLRQNIPFATLAIDEETVKERLHNQKSSDDTSKE